MGRKHPDAAVACHLGGDALPYFRPHGRKTQHFKLAVPMQVDKAGGKHERGAIDCSRYGLRKGSQHGLDVVAFHQYITTVGSGSTPIYDKGIGKVEHLLTPPVPALHIHTGASARSYAWHSDSCPCFA
ncbi:hypothetical protein SDC9_123531 [bioreactor metagenome]|uniref:Uncharacterized protein n=1 Tax=bioreactor metagenome TaxID=1076179 RepID=A0A645CHV9_9ZZZZ